ncbi:MAG TPA: ROK family protein [Acidimicrobiales bacterium]|nr:ROK family protein [Acidimicrobiales bacterium]
MPSSDTESSDDAAPLIAGIDIGGTKCLGLCLAPDGSVLVEERLPTPRGAASLTDTVARLVETLCSNAGAKIGAVGVGAPGLVDRNGVLRAAPNLTGITEMPIRDMLTDRLGVRVTVDNDATCATEAEWRLGAAAGSSDALLITLGTGIGGGVVSGGALQRGANGFMSEPGHMVIDPNGPPCVCGRRGCWERYASGSGLARLARDAALGGRAQGVVDAAGGDPEAVRGEHVTAAARAGDAGAYAILDDFAWWLALGLANLTNLFDPEVIVLGGGLVEESDLLLGPIIRMYGDLLYAAGHRPRPKLVPAVLGEHAGAMGAALIASSALRSHG